MHTSYFRKLDPHVFSICSKFVFMGSINTACLQIFVLGSKRLQKPWDVPGCFWMPSDAARSAQVLPVAHRSFQIRPDAHRCPQMFLDGPGCCQMLPGGTRCSQVIRRCSQMECFQIPSVGPGCSQMFPSASRKPQMPTYTLMSFIFQDAPRCCSCLSSDVRDVSSYSQELPAWSSGWGS